MFVVVWCAFDNDQQLTAESKFSFFLPRLMFSPLVNQTDCRTSHQPERSHGCHRGSMNAYYLNGVRDLTPFSTCISFQIQFNTMVRTSWRRFRLSKEELVNHDWRKGFQLWVMRYHIVRISSNIRVVYIYEKNNWLLFLFEANDAASNNDSR